MSPVTVADVYVLLDDRGFAAARVVHGYELAPTEGELREWLEVLLMPHADQGGWCGSDPA